MRISPINTMNQNNKKQSFTAFKVDGPETIEKIREFSNHLGVKFYTLSEAVADFRDSKPSAVPMSIGHFLSKEDKAQYGEVKDVYITTTEIIDAFIKTSEGGKTWNKALEEIQLEGNKNVVTKESAEAFVDKSILKLGEIIKGLNTLVGNNIK